MIKALLKHFKFAAIGFSICVLFSLSTTAQIGGSGWKPLAVKFNVQSPTNAPQSSRYFFTNNIFHCLTFSNDGAFAVGSTTDPRTEQRFTPDYTNGEIQYQATMMAPSTENSYCVFQIHTGDALEDTFGSTTFMAFWFTNSGGSIHDYSGTTLATNLGGQWFQLNVDHNLVTQTIRVWVNNQLVWTQQDNAAGDFYFKDGVYVQDHGPTFQMDTYITNTIQEWISSGTNPPAAPMGLAATPTMTQIPLTWDSSVAATNYNLKRSSTSGGPYTILASLSGTNYTDTTAVSGTTYYYVVSALDQFGESSNSTQIAASLFSPGYQLSATPSTAAIFIGGSTNVTLTMTTNSNFSGSVNFTVSGLPANTTATFNPASLSGSGTSTLTITTTTGVPAGAYPLTINGNSSGVDNTADVAFTINSGIVALPGTLVWTGTNNWSVPQNWMNLTSGGFGPPGISNDVVFTNLATVATSNTVNNIVNSDVTINSLTFNNTNGFHTTQIVPGSTLTISGSGGLLVGTESDLGGAAAVYDTIAGAGGALVCSNSSVSLIVRQGASSGGSQRATLDLSGLDTFNATVNQVSVGAAGPIVRATGTLALAKTNSITASGSIGILVGDNGSNGGAQNNLYLGQSNSIYADSITIGRSKCPGVLMFNTVFKNSMPGLYLRGVTSSRVSALNIGDNSGQTTSSSSSAGTMDLSGGAADIMANTMVVGKGQTSTGTGTATGTLTLNAGTLDVNTLDAGYQNSSSAAAVVTGTVNVNGAATLRVNSMLRLAHYTGSGTLPVGTLNVSGGTVSGSGDIVAGGGTSTLSINGGTLSITGTVGATGAPIGKVALTNASLQFSVNAAATNLVASSLVTGGSSNRINVTSLPVVFTPAQITLIAYSNSIAGAGFNFVLGTPVSGGGFSAYLSNNVANSSVDLVFVSLPPSPPAFAAVGGSGANLIFGVTNGIPNRSFYILGTTNLALPFSQWPCVATNVFDSNGNFTFTNSLNPNIGQQYYLLELQ